MTKIDQVVGKKFIRKKSYLGEKEKESLYIVEGCDHEEFAQCRYVLLFFSAGWCPPCEQFLQVLKDFYSEVNIDQHIIEIIYVTGDKSEQDFKETYAKMPWFTYPFNDATHSQLKKKHDIVGVPVVFVLDARTGFLITKKGRKDICDLGVNCLKNWSEEMPEMIAKMEHLAKGAQIVHEAKLAQEAEEKRKRDAEKENE